MKCMRDKKKLGQSLSRRAYAGVSSDGAIHLNPVTALLVGVQPLPSPSS